MYAISLLLLQFYWENKHSVCCAKNTHKLNYLRKHKNNTKAQLNAVGLPRPHHFFERYTTRIHRVCDGILSAIARLPEKYGYTNTRSKTLQIVMYIIYRHYISIQFTFGPKPSRPKFSNAPIGSQARIIIIIILWQETRTPGWKLFTIYIYNTQLQRIQYGCRRRNNALQRIYKLHLWFNANSRPDLTSFFKIFLRTHAYKQCHFQCFWNNVWDLIHYYMFVVCTHDFKNITTSYILCRWSYTRIILIHLYYSSYIYLFFFWVQI